jgi:hypothetical protein
VRITSERYEIGAGYVVEFRFTGRQIDVDWLPSMPAAEVGRTLLPAYRAARNEFLSKLSASVGKIVVVDL